MIENQRVEIGIPITAHEKPAEVDPLDGLLRVSAPQVLAHQVVGTGLVRAAVEQLVQGVIDSAFLNEGHKTTAICCPRVGSQGRECKQA